MGHRSQHVSNALVELLRRAETKVEACHRACEELLRKTEVLGGNVKGRILLSGAVRHCIGPWVGWKTSAMFVHSK